MIKTKDLMIGNYLDFDGEVAEVKEIDEYGVVVHIEEGDEAEWIDISQFSPIYLTEEILLKNDFEVYEPENDYFRHSDIAGLFIFRDDVLSYSIDSVIIAEVRYLHELQNLFSVLTVEGYKYKIK